MVILEVFPQDPPPAASFGPRYGIGVEVSEHATSWLRKQPPRYRPLSGSPGFEIVAEFHYEDARALRLNYRYGRSVSTTPPSWSFNGFDARLRSTEAVRSGHVWTVGHQWSTETRLRPLVGIDLLFGFNSGRSTVYFEEHELVQPGDLQGGTVLIDAYLLPPKGYFD